MSKQIKETVREDQLPPGWDIPLPEFLNPDNYKFTKINISQALLFFIVIFFLMNQYIIYTMNKTKATELSQKPSVQTNIKLTSFDEQLVAEQKQKNNGQISAYGSQHIHADYKVYINGQALDLAKQENYVKAKFMHIEPDPSYPDEGVSVLHNHAKYVPLNFFFNSIGMKLAEDSIKLQDGQILTNSNENTLKFYLNGKKVDELGNYTPQDLDKLLVSYGPANDLDIQQQINSITNFAVHHQEK